MKVVQSRNKREGRFIAGWCRNPYKGRYKVGRVQPVRAGEHNDLVVRVHGDLGKSFTLVNREQV